jgi:hypothetical protein
MSSRTFRRTALSAVLTAAAATAAIMAPGGGALAAAPDASPVPQWATDGLSMIHPGVVTVTKNQSCTSNFVFLDEKNNAYLGQAAHCSGTGNASETNGCSAKSLPLGTPVTLGASGAKGKMVYNSWLAMQEAGETDKNACADNDFALVSIPKSALSKVNPTIPVFGGPTGLRSGELKAGEAVLSYGNSPLRGGLSVLSPKQGVSLGTERDGWGHTVYTATPGVPGDSGSGFFDAQGEQRRRRPRQVPRVRVEALRHQGPAARQRHQAVRAQPGPGRGRSARRRVGPGADLRPVTW